ncbi:hypothetical protein [Poseidonibacter ostreae]|uniref:Uncharacterized protein n=1 Tax=Poseidonibacter ostreae TaxID=2654171 RepID=A0A6L4WWX0_9BACT|nr:hypothetical protein [Poseidonibacter ostreae]KAB7891438.1 hypothetical protein GBG19_00955 [Poseidonibacter ostreae]
MIETVDKEIGVIFKDTKEKLFKLKTKDKIKALFIFISTYILSNILFDLFKESLASPTELYISFIQAIISTLLPFVLFYVFVDKKTKKKH